MKKYDYLIIGASAAGVAAASKLRSLQSDATIACFDAQKDFPYNTCLLVDLLAEKKTEEMLHIKPIDFFIQSQIDLYLQTRVTQIFPEKRSIETDQGLSFFYEKLLLATGTKARKPPFFFNEIKGIFSFHSKSDVENIKKYIVDHQVTRAIVVGLGLSGVEAADALVSQGIKVLFVEKEEKILPHFLNQQASDFLKQKIESFGVSVKTGHSVIEIEKKNGSFSGVVLSDQKKYEAELLLVTIGAEPELTLAKQAHLKYDEYLAIETNQFLQTTQPSIFAAGDVVQVVDALTGQKVRTSTWPDAVRQGMLAAINMVQAQKEQSAFVLLTSSHFFGVAFLSAGYIDPEKDMKVLCDLSDRHYYQFVLKDERLVGVIMVGELKNVGYIRRALQEQFIFDLDVWMQ